MTNRMKLTSTSSSTSLFSSSSAEHDEKDEKGSENKNDENYVKDEKDIIYKELKQLSMEIRKHDTLYYTPGQTVQISDDEYDALTKREAELCISYPTLLQKLEEESGLGSKATRYGGRVGLLIDDVGNDDGNDDDDDNDNGNGNGQKSESNASNEETGSTTSTRSAKIVHLKNAPMQSLDNAMNSNEVVKWLNRVRKKLLKAAVGQEEEQEEEEEEVGREEEKQCVDKVIAIIAEPKMDGLSLSLRYELVVDGANPNLYVLNSGSTRGDGYRGEDVTEAIREISSHEIDDNYNACTMGMIPLEFHLHKKGGVEDVDDNPLAIEVRGEVVLPSSTFHEMVKAGNEEDASNNSHDSNEATEVKKSGSLRASQFSNARNAASGILLRRKSGSEMTAEEIVNTRKLRQSLRFHAYSIAFSDENNSNDGDYDGQYYSNGEELREILKEMGFSLPDPSFVTNIILRHDREVDESDCEEIIQFHDVIMKNRDKSIGDDDSNSFDFDIDGAVYKVSSVQDRNDLGKSYQLLSIFCSKIILFSSLKPSNI